MSKLNEQTIYNKEFNVEFKGYSMIEVDSFLDQIMLDYQYFQFELQKSKEIIQSLQQQNTQLQARLIEAQGKNDALLSTDPSNSNQVDLLKRLAKLEQEVYNK
ncbi:MAG TPA: DivIVA domain-containing protein [Erysipelotrichaceae bacterium]|nr:DivIVA domain-containing protein [Erysipelotrichaceae bacterium]